MCARACVCACVLRVIRVFRVLRVFCVFRVFRVFVCLPVCARMRVSVCALEWRPNAGGSQSRVLVSVVWCPIMGFGSQKAVFGYRL